MNRSSELQHYIPLKNVFQLYIENKQKLPLKVRKWRWHETTYFSITEIKDGKWYYYQKKAKLYGKIYGDMYCKDKLSKKNIKLENSGSYQWQLVKEKRQLKTTSELR